jgi:sugar phosphate isomerase/epimerase
LSIDKLRGPGLFLAQFIDTTPPFDTLDGLAGWAAGLGFRAVQIPTSAPHIFDLPLAARSQAYCDDVQGRLAAHGLVISELSTHLQGQLLGCTRPTTRCSTASPTRLCAAARPTAPRGPRSS